MKRRGKFRQEDKPNKPVPFPGYMMTNMMEVLSDGGGPCSGPTAHLAHF